jgi:hypothetical protein
MVDIENQNIWQSELTVNAVLMHEWEASLQQYLKDMSAICKSTGTSYGYVNSADQVPDEMRKLFMQAKQYAKRH